MSFSNLTRLLKKHSLTRNITQTQLANLAGVSRDTVSRMERGCGVTMGTFIQISMALGINNFESLLPDNSVRPIDRVNLGHERIHARPKKKKDTGPWKWKIKE